MKSKHLNERCVGLMLNRIKLSNPEPVSETEIIRYIMANTDAYATVVNDSMRYAEKNLIERSLIIATKRNDIKLYIINQKRNDYVRRNGRQTKRSR